MDLGKSIASRGIGAILNVVKVNVSPYSFFVRLFRLFFYS